MADNRLLCRLLFSDGGRIYARTQMLDPVAAALIREWLENGKRTGDDHPIKLDLGQGWEWVVHAELQGARP